MASIDTLDTEPAKKRVKWDDLKKALGVFRYIGPYRYTYLIGIVFLIFSTIASLLLPFLISELVAAAEDKSTYFSSVNQVVMALVGILVVQAIFSYGRVYAFYYVTTKTTADVRTDIYDRIISLPVGFFENKRVGELISRITSDVSKLEETLSLSLAEFFRQVATLIIGPVFLLMYSVKLTLLMLATFPFIVIILVVFGKFIRKLSKTTQDTLAETNTVVDETFHAVNTVKAFTNEAYESQRYSHSMQAVIDISLRLAKYRGAFISSLVFGLFGGIILVMWYGATLVQAGTMEVSQLMGFVLYTIFVGGALAGMGELYAKIQSTVGGTERLLEIINEPAELDFKSGAQHLQKFTSGHIKFDNVVFRYPSRPDVTVLKGISFEIKNGEKIALVGPSGAGKSTITQLLLGYYHIADGRISINNKDLDDYALLHLRYNIGIVPQDITLFGGTIGENIAYGKPGASKDAIIDAAKKANAWDFISTFPDGLDTVVGERGVKLSGGQKQRVAIARTILKDPAILILDEATSSLDAESEQLVQQALEALMKDRTSIVIAHRLSTIRKVDKILVINEGQIQESGTHAELAANPEGLYNHLLKLQFAED